MAVLVEAVSVEGNNVVAKAVAANVEDKVVVDLVDSAAEATF